MTVSLSKIQSAGSYSAYMAGATAEKADYYLSSEQGANGQFYGAGAEKLGLGGAEVTRDQLADLLTGKLPNGEQLPGGSNGNRVPGWDVTFSAPKSLSVMALVADDKRLLAAHDAAVKKALDHVEQRYIKARVTANGVTEQRLTGHLVSAVVQHYTSRAADPQVHTHALIANVTQREDGKWTAIESRSFYESQKAIGDAYHSFLAKEVEALGYSREFLKEDRALWDIRGVDHSVKETFSKQAEKIEAALEERGKTRETASAAEKERAALEVREAKKASPEETLKAGWKNEITPSQLRALEDLKREAIQRSQGAEHNQRIQDEYRKAGAEVVGAAVSAVSERAGQFTHKQLEEKALKLGEERTTVADVERAIRDRVASGDLIERQVKQYDAKGFVHYERGYTTRELADAERRLLAAEQRGRGVAEPLMNRQQAEATVKRFEAGSSVEWNDKQRAAAIGILSSDNRVTVLQGLAGSAKTSSVLASLSAVAKEQGIQVVAMAPTNNATQILAREVGGEGKTVQSHVTAAKIAEMRKERDLAKVDAKIRDLSNRLKAAKSTIERQRLTAALGKEREKLEPLTKQEAQQGKQLWIIDESSMIGAKSMEQVIKDAEAVGAKIVLTGDDKQMGSVEAGRSFAQLQEAGAETYKLTDIYRQSNLDTRQAVYAAVEGRFRESLEKIEQGGGRVIEIQTPKKEGGGWDKEAGEELRTRAIAQLILEKQGNAVAITLTHEARLQVAEHVRAGLREQGILTSPDHKTMQLESKQLSGQEVKQAGAYAPGDVIRFEKEFQDKGVAAGSYWTVKGVDLASQRVSLVGEKGQEISWKPSVWGGTKSSAFTIRESAIAVGDQVRMTEGNKAAGIGRGQEGVVSRIADGVMSVTMKDGAKHDLPLNREQGGHWRHAYSDTAYGVQGATSREVIAYMPSFGRNTVNEKSFYVALSRAKDAAHIVTDSRKELENSLHTRSGIREGALDNAREIEARRLDERMGPLGERDQLRDDKQLQPARDQDSQQHDSQAGRPAEPAREQDGQRQEPQTERPTEPAREPGEQRPEQDGQRQESQAERPAEPARDQDGHRDEPQREPQRDYGSQPRNEPAERGSSKAEAPRDFGLFDRNSTGTEFSHTKSLGNLVTQTSTIDASVTNRLTREEFKDLQREHLGTRLSLNPMNNLRDVRPDSYVERIEKEREAVRERIAAELSGSERGDQTGQQRDQDSRRQEPQNDQRPSQDGQRQEPQGERPAEPAREQDGQRQEPQGERPAEPAREPGEQRPEQDGQRQEPQGERPAEPAREPGEQRPDQDGQRQEPQGERPAEPAREPGEQRPEQDGQRQEPQGERPAEPAREPGEQRPDQDGQRQEPQGERPAEPAREPGEQRPDQDGQRQEPQGERPAEPAREPGEQRPDQDGPREEPQAERREDLQAEPAREQDGQREEPQAERREDLQAEPAREQDGRREDLQAEPAREQDGRREDLQAEPAREQDGRREDLQAEPAREQDGRREESQAEPAREQDGRREESQAEPAREQDGPREEPQAERREDLQAEPAREQDGQRQEPQAERPAEPARDQGEQRPDQDGQRQEPQGERPAEPAREQGEQRPDQDGQRDEPQAERREDLQAEPAREQDGQRQEPQGERPAEPARDQGEQRPDQDGPREEPQAERREDLQAEPAREQDGQRQEPQGERPAEPARDQGEQRPDQDGQRGEPQAERREDLQAEPAREQDGQRQEPQGERPAEPAREQDGQRQEPQAERPAEPARDQGEQRPAQDGQGPTHQAGKQSGEAADRGDKAQGKGRGLLGERETLRDAPKEREQRGLMGERDSLRDTGKAASSKEKAATERPTERAASRDSGGWER
ncbi:MobF family relaxase (plasmid) [Pseudomonas aeruginosa]|nr:MobF family relaxase [Pseudomonas aeruginosa]